MKRLLFIILIVLACQIVKAQTDTLAAKPNTVIRICTPSRGQMIKPPLYIIFYGKNKHIITQDTHSLDPQSIKSINVIKGAGALNKYGEDARFGAVEVYLKRGKRPGNYNAPPIDTLIRYRR